MPQKAFYQYIIPILLFLFGMFCFVKIYQAQEKYKFVQQDYTEVHNIKYGLFNPQIWKEKIATALVNRIQDFDLSGSNREMVQQKIESALHILVDNINEYLEMKRNEGGFLKQIVANITISSVYDETQLRGQIPEISAQILQQLETENTQEQIKAFLIQEMDTYLASAVSNLPEANFSDMNVRYGTNNLSALQKAISVQKEIHQEEKAMWGYVLFGVGIVLFLWVYFMLKSTTYATLLSFLVFWIPGITFPLMSVGVALDKVAFQILGENFEFTHQILFYESKSILDLVKILIEQKDFLSIIVGVLVVFFSVIFPIIKIGLSFYFRDKVIDNSFIHYLVYYGGKWSMADVFVVAIFMAFIGFRTLVSSQLETLQNTANYTQIETSDLTQLHFPVLFFVAFVLGNVLFSSKKNILK